MVEQGGLEAMGMRMRRLLIGLLVVGLCLFVGLAGSFEGPGQGQEEGEKEPGPGSYSYEQEHDELGACEGVNTICLHFFALDGSGTNLAWGATYDKDQVFGKLSPDAKGALDRLVALVGGLWDQCCVQFELGIARAVKPEKISAGAGKTLKDLLTRTAEGDVIVKAARKKDREGALDLAEEALKDIKAKLQGKGEWPEGGDKCLTVFLVGEVEDPKLGFARMPGKVTIFELSYRKETLFEPPQIHIFEEEQAVRGLAHEFGHNLGLAHPDEMEAGDCKRKCMGDRMNLMWPDPGDARNPRSNLKRCQCAIVEDTKRDLGLMAAHFSLPSPLELERWAATVIRPDQVAPDFWGYISRGREAEPVSASLVCTGEMCALTASGGIEGVHFELAPPGTTVGGQTSTALPPGLKLHEQIGAIWGIPRMAGTWRPVIQAVDEETSAAIATLALELKVEPNEPEPPPPRPSCPPGSEEIRFTRDLVSGAFTPPKIVLEPFAIEPLVRSDRVPFDLSLHLSGTFASPAGSAYLVELFHLTWSYTYTDPDPAVIGDEYYTGTSPDELSWEPLAPAGVTGGPALRVSGGWTRQPVSGPGEWRFCVELVLPGAEPEAPALLDHTMCRDVQPNFPYDPIGPTYEFSRSDEKAVSWVKLGPIYRAHQVRWEWYSPQGSLYWIYTAMIPDPRSSGYDRWEWYKIWSWIAIRGHEAARLPGSWRVDLYLDEHLILTERFTIR